MKKLSKEEFVKALEKNPSMLLFRPEYTMTDNYGNTVVVFDDCKDTFSTEEADNLFIKYSRSYLEYKVLSGSNISEAEFSRKLTERFHRMLAEGHLLTTVTLPKLEAIQGSISYPAGPSFVNVFGDKAFRVHQKTLYYRKQS